MTPLPFTLLFWVQVYTPFLCLLSREYPLAYVGELVWWYWILSAFACLKSFWFLLHTWMRSLLGTIIWAVGYFLSSFEVCLAIPSWLEEFLLTDAGRGWGQEEKGTTEDEMAAWHHWLDGSESEWTPGVGDGQGDLVCWDSWGHKESDTTEWLKWTDWTELLFNFRHVTQLLMT